MFILISITIKLTNNLTIIIVDLIKVTECYHYLGAGHLVHLLFCTHVFPCRFVHSTHQYKLTKMHVILIFIYYLDLVVNSLFLLCTIVSVQNEQNNRNPLCLCYCL